MLINQDQPAGAANNNDLIFDVGTADFEDKVMRGSIDTPILVDFWAPWCGPCKQLGPMLEQAVTQAGGKIRMAKVNIDENPELAQALRVQSVPMVFAFFGGQPVNAFVGVKAPGELKSFIDQMIEMARQARPDALDIPQALSEAAQALSAGDLDLAQGLYVQVLGEDEQNAQAYAGLIRTFIAAGQAEHAQEMINNVPDAISGDAAFAAAKTALELAMDVPVHDFSHLEEKLAKNPADHAARFDLAVGLFSAGEKERAIDELVEIVRRDRKWEDDKARLQLLKFFEALGFADPLAAEGRRKLSAVLFS
ncbi:MAG: tetratricopeptide repeat protein [Rhodospirillales bacterium]|nr:tetratricopeptide repeat protein [Rhodospirillales bacterium]MCB9997287.1 tetratricopeptide repeat protein [Rhodospirillales bacterium]